MKKRLFLTCCAFGYLTTSVAQVHKRDSLKSSTEIEEDAGPLVLKFEPKLDITENRKRKLFRMKRQEIDTMQISEKKKQRLLRKLHKGIYNGKFENTVITHAILEDAIEN